jgi:hypothetical protein
MFAYSTFEASFFALIMVAWASNLMASTFYLSSFNFISCFCNITFHLASLLSSPSFVLDVTSTIILSMDASTLANDDTKFLSAFAFLLPVGAQPKPQRRGPVHVHQR